MAQANSPGKSKRIVTATLALANVSSSLIPPKIPKVDCQSESSDDEDVRLPRQKRTNRKMILRDFVIRMEKKAEENPVGFRTDVRMCKTSLDKLMSIVGKH